MSTLRCPHSFVFFLRPARRERRAGFPTRFGGKGGQECPRSVARIPLSFFFELLDANGERVFQPALEGKADKNIRSPLPAFVCPFSSTCSTRTESGFSNPLFAGKGGQECPHSVARIQDTDTKPLQQIRSLAQKTFGAATGVSDPRLHSVLLPHLIYPQLNLPLLKDKQSPFLVP
jgi:hypothetical protein